MPRQFGTRNCKPEDHSSSGDRTRSQQKGTRKMSNKEKALQSGSAAIVLFTTLSSATAIAAAFLPFIIR
jgi:hypothetical protein